MTELLVGTKKGLFVLRGDPSAGEPFEIATRAFAGDVVEFAIRDPRTGRYFASQTSGFYGPRLMYTDDPTGDWIQANGPAFPEGGDATLERIWMIEPGETDGLLYAGVAPAALFISTDDGESWSLNEPLWKEHQAGDWQPGAGGLALHSICPWPGDPQRLAVGVSAAGVWITDDAGQSWRSGFTGMVPEYMPEEAREGTNALCVHNMHRAPTRPERLFMQFHGNVYRSDDEGSSWNEIQGGTAEWLRIPTRGRSGRRRQRVRDPAGRSRGSCDSRRSGACVRDEGCRLDVERSRRGPAGERGLPDRATPGVRRRRRGFRTRALLRRHERRCLRLRRRRRVMVPGARTSCPRHERPGRLIAADVLMMSCEIVAIRFAEFREPPARQSTHHGPSTGAHGDTRRHDPE